jgi:hypothetical protein
MTIQKEHTIQNDNPKKNTIMVVTFASPEALLWQMRQYFCGNLLEGIGQGGHQRILSNYVNWQRKKLISKLISLF